MSNATDIGSISDFIEARLAEDEGIAREAADLDAEGPSWRVRKIRDDGMYVFGEGQAAPPGGKLGMSEDAQTIHVARHDPARVLRQCAALRWTLDLIKGNWEDNLGSVDRASEADRVNDLAMIAAIWSGHPDFRQEW
ncbi:MAG: DUF6221 family protein, partial [Bryobacteraceae bacterium]